jgi:hypothetical protein
MADDQQILGACGRALVAAQDGRGMWRPVKRCTDDLVATGCRPALAMQCAAAMVAVAQAVRDLQAQAVVASMAGG